MIHLPDIFENGLVWNNIHQANLYLAKKKVKMVMQNILTCFFTMLWNEELNPNFGILLLTQLKGIENVEPLFLAFFPAPMEPQRIGLDFTQIYIK